MVAGVVARVVACPCAFLARVGRPPRWPSELVRHRGIAETFSLEEEVEALARLLEEVVDVVDVEDVVLLLDTGLGREGGREGEREVRGWRLVGVEESTAEGAIVGQTGGRGATGGPRVMGSLAQRGLPGGKGEVQVQVGAPQKGRIEMFVYLV